MKRLFKISVFVCALLAMACNKESKDSFNYTVKHYLCTFEGTYWNSLVDTDPNGNNLLNGSLPTSWHDEKSDLAGEVTIPFEGYWGGLALSNHCSKEYESNGKPTDQLYAYVDNAYSGQNFLICNCFFGGVELSFKSKTSYLESMMVANTTYSYSVVTNGNHLTVPLGDKESIWIEAYGYINGSDEVQATVKFYLYENGKPAFEGWKEWKLAPSMCRADKIVFDIKWSGTDYNPYPAYFAIDDIKVVRQERIK